jgi:predicted metal-dependent HD superfamily phosphohydrolase
VLTTGLWDLHRHYHTHVNQPRAVLVIDMGRLIKDVESVVVAFDSTDGVYMTTAEDVALANTTNDSPFMVTRHVYLRSTGSTRISFATIYVIYFFVKLMTASEEVSAPLALSRDLTLLFTNEFDMHARAQTHTATYSSNSA